MLVSYRNLLKQRQYTPTPIMIAVVFTHDTVKTDEQNIDENNEDQGDDKDDAVDGIHVLVQ